VSRFFNNLQINSLKIYQDGLVAGGEAGLKIVNEGARQGSVNYQIIAGLVSRGGIIVKTEEISLVRKEYDLIKKMTSAKSPREIKAAALAYKLAQNKLLEERDAFIARTIDATLADGDAGTLFIGAYHDVLSKLSTCTNIVQVKDMKKVQEYHKLLSKLSVSTREQFIILSDYLVSPVTQD
jgi:pheromone shutdown protein TraB